MKGLLLAAICCGVLIAGSARPSAHDEFRIIGAVTKVTATSLDVKQTKDGQVVSMKMDKETTVTRDGRKVERVEIKTGGSVVVDALGDSLKDLLVLEVRLVPIPKPAKKK
jgi:uncharacterized cupredoxin-like copper-binding protein